MSGEDLGKIYADITIGVQDIFKSNKSLVSFSWSSDAIWNDDWYDNTVSKIIVNEQYIYDGFGEIKDIKEDFCGPYFQPISKSQVYYLNLVTNQYLEGKFDRLLFLYSSFKKDYQQEKQEIIDLFEMAFSLQDFFIYHNKSTNDKKYVFAAESFFHLYEKVDIKKGDDTLTLLQFILIEEVLKSFITIVDKNQGLQQLIYINFNYFIEIAKSYCKKLFVKELLNPVMLTCFKDICYLLDKVFTTYYTIDSPLKNYNEIQVHEIIPSLSATREVIELTKWRTI